MSSNSSTLGGYRSAKKPRGYAVLAGLSRVDAAAYGGWTGENGCWGCELDVDNMMKIMAPLGFTAATLKTEKATAENILKALRAAAKMVKPGDIFVFYYSGHGGTAVDANGDEIDKQDETLIAYDRPLLDDELAEVWNEFEPGVRIFMASDSCHSGTNFRALGGQPVRAPALISSKSMREMRAQLIHMGGCRDDGTSAGYTGGGAFTMALCDIWHDGAFKGNYSDLLKKVAARVRETQIPQYNEYGPVSGDFRGQKPFTIQASGMVTPEPPIVEEPGEVVPPEEGEVTGPVGVPAGLKEALIQAIADVFDNFAAQAGTPPRARKFERGAEGMRVRSSNGSRTRV
ncbi:MAG: caspase family protein [Polyangiaceae bacterium]|nr:caspase family protein [Polyangiaceae bacterium]